MNTISHGIMKEVGSDDSGGGGGGDEALSSAQAKITTKIRPNNKCDNQKTNFRTFLSENKIPAHNSYYPKFIG